MDDPLVLDLDLVQIHLWTVFLLGSIFGYMEDNSTFLMEDVFLNSVCVCVNACACMRSNPMAESSGLFVTLWSANMVCCSSFPGGGHIALSMRPLRDCPSH